MLHKNSYSETNMAAVYKQQDKQDEVIIMVQYPSVLNTSK